MTSPSITLDLHNRSQAWAVIKNEAYPFIANWLQAGKRLVLVIRIRARTTAQNKRYWGKGVLAQIAEQAAPNGKLYSAEVWHEQFKRQFIGVEELPNGSVIGKSSTELTTIEFADFCTQVEAYAAQELGVVFYDLEAQ